MRIPLRRIAKWVLWGLAVVAVVFGLYLSLYFFPYPLFRHRAEFDGFAVYSDGDIPQDFERIIDEARRRIEAMELYRGADNPRIFICRSQRLFETLVRLTGKRHSGQALVITAANNAFFSPSTIEAIGRRNKGQPIYSRLAGSWAAAIAHEVAHIQMVAVVGRSSALRMPAWKSEGYADFAANRAAAVADPAYVFSDRIGVLLDDSLWRSPTGSIDRRHFRWHVMVEYLCSIDGMTFAELLDPKVTDTGAWDEMMAWYRASGLRAAPAG